MKKVIDDATMSRMLTRITHEILEKNGNVQDTVLVGIKTRGVYLAKRLADRMNMLYQVTVKVESLDISNYRDDIEPTGNPTGITSSLEGKTVILVDDVLYTGRSIRAALDAVIEHGRPQQIQLVTLIDRGHREFPIRPDYVGKNLPTARTEDVIVHVSELDGDDYVAIEQQG